jgi:hypothetical protein
MIRKSQRRKKSDAEPFLIEICGLKTRVDKCRERNRFLIVGQQRNHCDKKFLPGGRCHCRQGCQMVSFQTKNPIWVNFGGP